MKVNTLKQARRTRRKAGIRKRIFGTPDQPRLTVYRGIKHTYAQIIDDLAGKTLVSASSMKLDGSGSKGNKTAATQVGKALAEKAKAVGITVVSFDRNGFRYHGRVKALADAAREAGLKF